MKTQKLIRLQLDKQFDEIRHILKFERPLLGWVKTLRNALGMTAAQLAKRMNVSQARVSNIESAEIEGTLTLNKLNGAAEALNCKLVYFLIPEKNLEEIVKEQAKKAVLKNNENVAHSMGLEDQSVVREREFIEAEAETLIFKESNKIWES
ncbi:MAG: mobile mystery protein A [Alphaproteobacteria bacterium]|nr:mobile mystery protein A [Alphaproteobacteria bacterium]